MKLSIYLILSLLSLNVYSQSTIYWEPEITVADGSIYGNIRPRIVLTSGETPLVLLGKSGSGFLYTAKWDGSGFATPVSLLPDLMETYLATWTGPDMAAKGDTVIIVFKEDPIETGHVYTVRSVDGGLTYSDTIRTDSHENGIAWLPSLDIDENGNPSVVYMAHDPSWVHPRYVVTHSNDQGLTYEPEMDIAYSIPEEACDCCPAEYAINGNEHVLLFRNNDNNIRDIHAVYSNDDGASYPSVQNIDQLSWAVTSCPSTGPHGLFNGQQLFTVYASRASGNYRVYISETNTSPLFEFQERTMLTPPLNAAGSQNYPRISGKNDSLFVVWQESETSNNEIFCAFTTNGSVSEILTSKHQVNVNTSGSQLNPDITYADGFVHLVYQDAPSGDVIYRRGVVGSLGLDENPESGLLLYPNPTESSVVYLKTGNKAVKKISVIDINGSEQKVDVKNSPGLYSIDVKNSDQGIYFVRCEMENDGIWTAKLIIK